MKIMEDPSSLPAAFWRKNGMSIIINNPISSEFAPKYSLVFEQVMMEDIMCSSVKQTSFSICICNLKPAWDTLFLQ